MITIQFEDARQGLSKLPANSVDLILTDPPYQHEFVSLYGDLAREAKRVLKEGHYLFAYCGAHELPEILQLMTPHLYWFWLFEIKHNGGYPRMWNKKILVGSKPVVAFTKGKPLQLKWLSSLHVSKKADKKFHKWGQSCDFPRKIIEMYTKEGDTVLDPFVGGATTAKVCKELNREFVGFEIDDSLKEVVKSRMSQECLRQFLPAPEVCV